MEHVVPEPNHVDNLKIEGCIYQQNKRLCECLLVSGISVTLQIVNKTFLQLKLDDESWEN